MNRRLFGSALLGSLAALVVPAWGATDLFSGSIFVKMTIKFPEGKTYEEHLADKKLWISKDFDKYQEKFIMIGRLAKTQTTVFENRVVTEMIFNSKHDMEIFNDFVAKNKLINKDLRQKQGYKTEVTVNKYGQQIAFTKA